jgi:hypothetical protein
MTHVDFLLKCISEEMYCTWLSLLISNHILGHLRNRFLLILHAFLVSLIILILLMMKTSTTRILSLNCVSEDPLIRLIDGTLDKGVLQSDQIFNFLLVYIGHVTHI